MRKLMMASVALVMAGAIPAKAEIALHDITWYEQNGAARDATLRICRNDYSYAKMADCQNAEHAETMMWSNKAIGRYRRGRVPTPEQVLNDPRYWAGNRMARLGGLAECGSGRGAMTASMCSAARGGAAMDPGNRSGR